MASSPQQSPNKKETSPAPLSGRKHRYSSSTGRSSFWDDIIRAEEERNAAGLVKDAEEKLFETQNKRSKQGVGSLALEQHVIAHSAVVQRDGDLSSPKSLTRRRQLSIQGGNVESDSPSGNSQSARSRVEDDELERSGDSESSVVVYDDEQNLSDDEETVRKEPSKFPTSTGLRLDLSRVNSNDEGNGKQVPTQTEPKMRPHALRQRAPLAHGPQLRAYRKAMGARYLTPIMGDNPRAFVITTIEAMYFSGNTLYSQKWMLRYKNGPHLGPLLTPWPSAPKSSLPDDFNPAELDDEIEGPDDDQDPLTMAEGGSSGGGVDSTTSTPRRASAPTLSGVHEAPSSPSSNNANAYSGTAAAAPASAKRFSTNDSIVSATSSAASAADSPLRSSQSISSPTLSPRVTITPKGSTSSPRALSSSTHPPSAAFDVDTTTLTENNKPASSLTKTANDLSSKRQTATTGLLTGLFSKFKGRTNIIAPANPASGAPSSNNSAMPSAQSPLNSTGHVPSSSMNSVALGNTNASVLARLKDKLRPWDRRRARLRTSDPNVTPDGLSSDMSNALSAIDDESNLSSALDDPKTSLRASLALPLHGIMRLNVLPAGVMSDEEDIDDSDLLEETLDEEGDRVIRRLRRSGARFNRSRSRSALSTEVKTDAIRGPYFQRLQGMSLHMNDMADRMEKVHQSAENSLSELNATLERLNHGHDRLEVRFKKLSRQMEDTRNKTQSANALLIDNIQKSSNAIEHLRFKSRARGPMRIVFALLGWVVLIVGTLIWLVAATYRATARGFRWVQYKLFPSQAPPPASNLASKRPHHPTRRQGSAVTDSNRMINITLGKASQHNSSNSTVSPTSANSARSSGYGHRRSMSSSAAANYHEASSASAPVSPTKHGLDGNLSQGYPDSLVGASSARSNASGAATAREENALRLSRESGSSTSAASTITEEEDEDAEYSSEDDLVSVKRHTTNLSNSSFSSNSSGASANTGGTGGSVSMPVTSFAPNAAAAKVEAQQLATLEDMSRSIKQLRAQDKLAKRKAAAEKRK